MYIINRGKLVIIRAFAGEAIVRRVWSYDERAVYVTDESGFIRLLSGEDVMPIGFRREDTFKYNPTMAEPRIATPTPEKLTPPWGDMDLWREEPEK
jgi:hypothetical protein